MRPVNALAEGVSKFGQAIKDKTFQAVVKVACHYAIQESGLVFPTFNQIMGGLAASYFPDHFTPS